MNVSPKLINLTEQIKKNAQSTHQLATSAKTVGDTVISKDLAEGIYHKGKHIPQNSSTYKRPIEISSYKPERGLLVKMEQEIDYKTMPKQLVNIRNEVTELSQRLEELQPSLVNKDWGFSINKDNRIVATGNVNADEKRVIEKAFNNNTKILNTSLKIPDTFMKGQEYDRGYDGKGKYWGKYDVTRDNFSDIIDIKQLVDSSYFGAHEGEHFDVFGYGDNLRMQLAEKAEVKYGY